MSKKEEFEEKFYGTLLKGTEKAEKTIEEIKKPEKQKKIIKFFMILEAIILLFVVIFILYWALVYFSVTS